MINKQRLYRAILADKYKRIGQARTVADRLLAIEIFIVFVVAILQASVTQAFGWELPGFWEYLMAFLGLQVVVMCFVFLLQQAKKVGLKGSISKMVEVLAKTFLYVLLPSLLIALLLVALDYFLGN